MSARGAIYNKMARRKRYNACDELAEMEGFEPPDGVTRQLISSDFEYLPFNAI